MKPFNASPIQEHPEITGLKQRIAEVKGQVIDALAELDDIRLQQNPQIESEYALKIGCYETELLKAEIAERRAHRKLTLAQKAINAGEAIDERAIESVLDTEFAEWQRQLAEAMKRYQDILDERNSSQLLSEKDSKELAKLYRKIVKRLHPDINPSISEREQKLFLAAQFAYKNGDLTAIRAISVTVEGLGEAEESYPETEDLSGILEVELSMQQTTLSVLVDRLKDFKEQYPYNLSSKLADQAWIEASVKELKNRIEQHVAAEHEYANRLSNLKNSNRGQDE
jgi:hypothetical protein